MHAHGYPTGRRAWARAQLARGSSSGATWEISAEYPEARLTIGADPSAGWPIQASGVQPVHCELFWDGTALWVGDTHGAGGVFLDGQRVSDWVQVHGPAELRFGAAALDIETSPPEYQEMASRPDTAPSVTRVDMLLPSEDDARASGPIFGGAAGDDSIPELDAAATRVIASPLERAPAADALADLRPRLGGNNPLAGPAEATRMVAMPPAAPVRAAAPPPSAKSPPAAPPPPSFTPRAPALPEAPPEPVPPTPPAEGAASAFVAPPAAPEAPAKTSRLGPLLEKLAPILKKLKPESSAEVVSSSGGKEGQSLPTRTWIMLGVTLVAALGLLLWEEDAPEPAAPPAAPQAEVAAPAAAQAEPATAPEANEPTEPTEPTEPAAVALAPTAEPAAGAAAPEPSAAPAANEGDGTLQRRAIDHYIAGRYPEALTVYRQLAQADPSSTAYANMIQILERLIQCRDGVGPGGEPCSVP